MPKDRKATTPDLVRVCRRYYTRAEAEVAAELLFWSQSAKHTLRGGDRVGFFKENSELTEVIGKHASSIGRALKRIGAKPGEERPETLFVVQHGPRPWERSGRVRWLFITSRGHELIREALLMAEVRDKKRQKAFNVRSGKIPPVSTDCTERSAQKELTLIKQNHPSEIRSEALSSPLEREKHQPERRKNKTEEVERVATIWNEACHESGETALVWLPTEVRRFSAELVEIIDVMRLEELSNEELLKRFQLLCRKDSADRFGPHPSFKEHNRHGITAKSFALYGRELMRAVEAELTARATRPSLKDLYRSPPSPPKKELTAEELEHQLDRLVKLWERACLDQDQPSFIWNPHAVEKDSKGLRRFILQSRIHQIPEQKLLSHLVNVVRTFVNSRVSCDLAVQVFVLRGEWLFGLSRGGKTSWEVSQ